MSKKTIDTDEMKVIKAYESKRNTLRELLDNKTQISENDFKQAKNATNAYLKENKPLYDAAVAAIAAEKEFKALERNYNLSTGLASLTGSGPNKKDTKALKEAEVSFQLKSSQFENLLLKSKTQDIAPKKITSSKKLQVTPETQLLSLLEKFTQEKDLKKQSAILKELTPLLTTIKNKDVFAKIMDLASALSKNDQKMAQSILKEIKTIIKPPQKWIRSGTKEAMAAVKTAEAVSTAQEKANLQNTSPRGNAKK